MLSRSSRSILKRSFVSQRAPARLYSSTVHDNDPEVLDVEKRRNLAGKQHLTSTPVPEAPGWNEQLASSSEAHIKADKSGDTTATLVSKTVEYVRSRHAPEDRLENREAPYERDSVEGPLATGTAGSREPTFRLRTRFAGLRNVPVGEADPQLTESQVYKILEHATPSEEAVKSDRGEV